MREGKLALVFVALVALVASGCAGADGRFSSGDLGRIVLRGTDAPPGTVYATPPSGFQDIGAFARDQPERTKLEEEGFVVGDLALFVPSTSEAPSKPSNVTVLQGVAGLFDAASGASSAFDRYIDDLRSRQLPKTSAHPARGLGDDAVELQGQAPDGTHVIVFAWRVDNLVLAVVGSGAIGELDVRAIADLVDARASG